MPPPPPSPTAKEKILGTLIVIILRAKNLPNKVRIGKQNPYATIQYGLHKKRTSTIERGGQQPEWDAEFRFEILREGLGGEEQLAAEQSLTVTAAGGVGPALPSKEAAAAGAKLDKPRPSSLVSPPQTPGYAPGKRVLRVACWADDTREPKLIGEAEVDIEQVIRVGKFDEWVKLERKNRYAGEVYLEMTWYSNDPRPVKPARREPSNESAGGTSTAYGGAGSRVAEYSGSESGTEEWDGGSQVGLSGVGSTAPPPVDLGADYPDADLAPLNRSMSAMQISRPPLPQPPTSIPSSTSAYHMHSLSASQSYHQMPTPSVHSPTPDPYGSYSHYPPASTTPYPQDPYAAHSYTPAPPQPAYGNYAAGEFGAYSQPPPLPPAQHPTGEFERLAHQHYASQGQSQHQHSASTSSSHHRPLPHPGYSTTPAPPPPPSLYSTPPDPYASTPSPYPQPPPVQPAYEPQPPVPPIPPSGSTYWDQPLSPAASTTPAPVAGAYGSMTHSDSSRTIYAAPPQPPQPPPSFAQPPPPPSLSHSTSYPVMPQPPEPPSFAAPPVFSPPPPPPSLQGYPAPPPRPPSAYGAPPVPPLPPAPPQQPYYGASAGGYASPSPSTFSHPPQQPSYAPPPAAYGQPQPAQYDEYNQYGVASPAPGHGSAVGRPPLPQPPATPSGHRPLPGMFSVMEGEYYDFVLFEIERVDGKEE
ncbi:hypothetical protein JCM10207_003551 [Rhodosporidiobolus poonsookiae]